MTQRKSTENGPWPHPWRQALRIAHRKPRNLSGSRGHRRADSSTSSQLTFHDPRRALAARVRKASGFGEQAGPAALPLLYLPFGMAPRPLCEFHLSIHHALMRGNGLRCKGQVNVLTTCWLIDEANKCNNFDHGTPPSFAEPPPREGSFHLERVLAVSFCY
jgi:hypothetical protein